MTDQSSRAIRLFNELATGYDEALPFFRGFADGQTDPSLPSGCLGVNCALPCAETTDPVRQELARVRQAIRIKLRRRFA